MTRVTRLSAVVLVLSAGSALGAEVPAGLPMSSTVSPSSTMVEPVATAVSASTVEISLPEGKLGQAVPGAYSSAPVRVVAARISSSIENIPSAVTVIRVGDSPGAVADARAGDELVGAGAASFVAKYPAALDNISIRGYRNNGESEKSQVAVLVNGRQAGGSGLAKFPLEGLDSIEVVRGAGSALFGSSAMGGAVNLVPRRGRGDPAGTVAVEAGSWEHRKLRADYGGQAGPADFIFGASRTTSGPFEVPGYGYRNAGTEEWSGFVNAGVVQGGHRLGVSGFGWFGDVLHEPGMASFPNDPRQYIMKRFTTGEASLSGSFGGLSYDQAVYHTDDQDVYHEFYGGPESVSHYEWNETGGRHMVGVDMGRGGAVSAGLEWSSREANGYNLTAVPFYPASTRRNTAFLAEARVNLLRPLELSGGIRQDWFRQGTKQPSRGMEIPGLEDGTATWNATTAHGGMVLDFHAVRAYASVGSGFRAPVAYELTANYADPFFGNTYQGNPDLEPEHSLMAEGGIGIKAGVWDARAGYFRTRFTDKISAVQEGPALMVYRNLRGTTVSGLEFEAGADLDSARGMHVRPFVGGTWHDIMRNDDRDDAALKGTDDVLYLPEWFGTAGLALSRGMDAPGGWMGRVTAVAQGEKWEENFSNFKVEHRKPFVVFNADANYRVSADLKAYVVVQNLLNERYEYLLDYPMPGTTVVAGIEASF